jgi:hypothetical protein
MNVSMIRKTASKRSIRSGLAAAIALSVGLGSMGAAFAANEVDANELLLAINDLRVQVTPPGLGPVTDSTPTTDSVSGGLGDFSGFNAAAVLLSAPAPADGTTGRVAFSDLWAAAEDVYNTLTARCDYWVDNAAAPSKEWFTIDDVQARVDALWAGAREAGAPGVPVTVEDEEVAALVAKSEDFLDGLALVAPMPIAGRVSVTKLNEQAEGVYQEIVGLCAAL